jgi:hypothetical protein
MTRTLTLAALFCACGALSTASQAQVYKCPAVPIARYQTEPCDGATGIDAVTQTIEFQFERERKCNAQRRMNSDSPVIDYCAAEISQAERRDIEAGLVAQERANNQRKKAAAEFSARSKFVSIGMTEAQVRKTQWGKPQHINSSTGRWGSHDQWVYAGNQYLYFENGILTSIQQSK